MNWGNFCLLKVITPNTQNCGFLSTSWETWELGSLLRFFPPFWELFFQTWSLRRGGKIMWKLTVSENYENLAAHIGPGLLDVIRVNQLFIVGNAWMEPYNPVFLFSWNNTKPDAQNGTGICTYTWMALMYSKLDSSPMDYIGKITSGKEWLED